MPFMSTYDYVKKIIILTKICLYILRKVAHNIAGLYRHGRNKNNSEARLKKVLNANTETNEEEKGN